MSESPAERPDPALAIAALRARGAQRLDPVRFRHIEALARRASAHRGEVRRLLDAKLEQLLEACGRELETRRSRTASAREQPRRHSVLAGLLAHMARHTIDPMARGHDGHDTLRWQPLVELAVVRDHRSTWSRLSVDQRLKQSLASVPGNAGPLNTPRLMHQSLMVLRDTSPEYLQRFMPYVEVLLWLDQASPPAVTAKKDPARRSRPR